MHRPARGSTPSGGPPAAYAACARMHTRRRPYAPRTLPYESLGPADCVRRERLQARSGFIVAHTNAPDSAAGPGPTGACETILALHRPTRGSSRPAQHADRARRDRPRTRSDPVAPRTHAAAWARLRCRPCARLGAAPQYVDPTNRWSVPRGSSGGPSHAPQALLLLLERLLKKAEILEPLLGPVLRGSSGGPSRSLASKPWRARPA